MWRLIILFFKSFKKLQASFYIGILENVKLVSVDPYGEIFYYIMGSD
jgi:hypothetical protein